MGATLWMRTENLDVAGIVRQDEQQVGLEPRSDSKSTLAVLPVNLDPFHLREGQV